MNKADLASMSRSVFKILVCYMYVDFFTDFGDVGKVYCDINQK